MRVKGGAKVGSERKTASRPVQSAARAVRILRSLLLAPEGKHLVELSAEMGLHKTTTLRLLRTLIAEDMVCHGADDKHFRLHPMSWITVATRMPAVSIAQVTRDLLDQLARSTGATAMIVLPMAGTRSVVATMWAVPDRVIHVEPGAQLQAPMHACAPGKCYLAGMPEEQLRRWVTQKLPKVTKRTTTGAAKLLKDLALVRQRGYAVDVEELVPGAAGLAVPVMDDGERPLAMLCLAAPAPEMTDANIARWLPLLRNASLSIGHALASLGTAVPAAAASRGLGTSSEAPPV